MQQTVAITFQLPVASKNRLDTIAKAQQCSNEELAARAVEEYLGLQEWQMQAIQEAVDEADSPDAEFLEHDEAVSRLKRLIHE